MKKNRASAIIPYGDGLIVIKRIKGNFENFILTSIKDKSYKIVTAAMILYNIDNR